jgi:hypothetical protein
MRIYRASLVIAAAVALCGCGKEDNSSSSGGGGALSAPAGYVGALAKGQQIATKNIDLASLNQNIQLFNAQEGRFPKDLDELVQSHYLPALPTPPAGMKLAYNPADGTVTMAPP